jgi:hypothetical protein
MYIVPNPIEVRAIEKYKIYIKFKNGEEKILDMKEMLDKKYYQKLKDYEYFKNVKISKTGITIEWEDGEDIAPENLYYDSNAIKNK